MPTFEFSAPDGQTYHVDGPDGATPEQAFAVLQSQIGANPTKEGAQAKAQLDTDQQPAMSAGDPLAAVPQPDTAAPTAGGGRGFINSGDDKPAPQTSGSTAKDMAINAFGGMAGGAAGAGAAFADAAGAKDVAAKLDEVKRNWEAVAKENGGDTLPGMASGIVGSVAPAFLVPEAKLAQMVGNAGLFGIPAFRDTLNAKLESGMSYPLALVHAAESFGVNMLMPVAARHGGEAAVNAVLGKGEQTLARTAAGTAAAGPVFGALDAASQVADKATDVAAGQDNDAPWVDGKRVLASTIAGAAMHAPQLAAHVGSVAADRVGSPAQQFGRAFGQDVDSAGFNPVQPANLNPNLRDVVPKTADPVADIFKTGSVQDAAAAAERAAGLTPQDSDLTPGDKIRRARPPRPVDESESTPDLPIRMGDDGIQPKSSEAGTSAPENLGRDQEPVQQPGQRGVSDLRGPGDQDASAVGDGFSGVRGPYGTEAQPGSLGGSDQQRRPLRAGERPLGDSDRAGAEQAEQPATGIQRADAPVVGVVGATRNRRANDLGETAPTRMVGREDAEHAAEDGVGDRQEGGPQRDGRGDQDVGAVGQVGGPEVRNPVQPYEHRRPQSTRGAEQADAQVAHEEVHAKPEPFATKPEANQAGLKEDAVAVPVEGGFALQLKTRPYSEREKLDVAPDLARLNRGLQVDSVARSETGLDDHAPAELLKTAPTPQMVVGRRIARLLGVKVVFVEDHVGFDGVSLKGVAYVSPQLKHPELAITGHEVLHSVMQQLRENDPARAQALHEQIAAYLRPEAVDKKQAAESDRSRRHAEEEVIADLNGSMWLDPKFWAEMRKNDPSTFRKVAYAFMQAIAHASKGLTRFKAESFATDVDAVRKILAREMAQLAREEAVESHSPTEKQELGIKPAADERPDFARSFDDKLKERSSAQLDEAISALGRDYVEGKLTHDEHWDRLQPLMQAKIAAENREKSAKVVTKYSEVHPGFTEIPVGTKVMATHGMTYKEPQRATVVGNKHLRVGDEMWKLPQVQFDEPKRSDAFADTPRTLQPADIHEVFRPRATEAERPAFAAKESEAEKPRKPGEVTREQARQMGDLRKKAKVLEALKACLE